MKFSNYIDKEEPAYEIFEICLDTVYSKDGCTNEEIDKLTPEARLVYLLCCFDGEIHNGGFDQLFTNSLGDHCLEILKGLSVIKANISYKLLKQAVSWFPDSLPPSNRTERWDKHQLFCEKIEYEKEINSLDNEFYKYTDNLSHLIDQYVKNNPNVNIRS